MANSAKQARRVESDGGVARVGDPAGTPPRAEDVHTNQDKTLASVRVTTMLTPLTSTTPTVLSNLSLLSQTILPNNPAKTSGTSENNLNAVVPHQAEAVGSVSDSGLDSNEATKPHHEQRKRKNGMAIAVAWRNNVGGSLAR
jgi:hypothetical protein